MKITVSKKNGVYTVFCKELGEIIASDSYLAQQYGTGECTDAEGAESALDEFHAMLRDIIGWYKYEVKEIPAILCDVEDFIMQFDKASYSSFYYNHPDTETYYIEGIPEANAKSRKKSKANKDRFKAIFFADHETLTGDVLMQDLNGADANSPFYDKKVVFTGILESISRGDAAEIVKSKGADINTSISGSTDYVIMGANAGPSKVKKIEDYNAKGANIKIISESEFLKMIE